MNKKRAEIRKIVSNLFIRLLSILAEEKINIGEQLRTFGLSRQEIDDLAENIDYETFYLFTEHILATHSIPAMGARFGASLNISDWGMFGTGILSFESLWGAYQTFGEVQEYTGDLVKLDLHDRGGEGVASISRLQRPALVPFYIEYVLANTWTNFIRPIQSPTTEAKLNRVRFTFPLQESHLDYYQAIFACPVEFDAPADELHFPKTLLHQPNPFRNQGALQFCLDQIQRIDLQMGGPGSYSQRVEQRVIYALSDSLESIEEMARELALSSRTLRRRLEAEGTTYNQIVQKVRMDTAKYYLSRTKKPVEHIAHTLQYSSITSFSRAFKHFTGLSPRAYRTSAQG